MGALDVLDADSTDPVDPEGVSLLEVGLVDLEEGGILGDGGEDDQRSSCDRADAGNWVNIVDSFGDIADRDLAGANCPCDVPVLVLSHDQPRRLVGVALSVVVDNGCPAGAHYFFCSICFTRPTV